ncbi:hypothetical protein Tco_1423848 [Tanacetum coccineum]
MLYLLQGLCRFGISASKEVDIGLGEGWDNPLRPADMAYGAQRKCVNMRPSVEKLDMRFSPSNSLLLGNLRGM